MSIDNFVGIWESSDIHTNPWKTKTGIPQKWIDRVDYYPDNGLRIEASKHPVKFFRDRDLVTQPDPIDVYKIKFRFLNFDPDNPLINEKAKDAIEKTDYNYFGNCLISSIPIQIDAATSFIEVLEFLPAAEVPINKDCMRHSLIWNNKTTGTEYIAKWICCLVSR